MNKLNRYLCYTDKSNLETLSKYNIRNLKVIDGELEFECGIEVYQALNNLINIDAIEIGRSKIITFLKKYFITLIGILLIIFALINLNSSITHIVFSDPDTENQEVLDYLDKYLKKVGPFSYLNDNLSNINLDLRKTFYHYEWIGIRRNGSYLYLDIKEIKTQPRDDDPRIGSYYASHQGIVKRYHVEKGIILVQEEQYVDKGEMLISGAIPKLGGEFDYLRAKGYVIAEVLQYKEFRIPVSELQIKKTGKLTKTKEIYLFNRNISRNKNKFIEFEKAEVNLFNLFNLFKIVDVEYYETKSITNKLTEEDAEKYAKSLVEKEFRRNKVNDFEKIIFNELVKIEKENDMYFVKLIVKTHQNIAMFIPDEIIDN